MKKLTDALSGIKNIFSRQQNSAEGTSAGCVEFTEAAGRTRGKGNRDSEGMGGAPCSFYGWIGSRP